MAEIPANEVHRRMLEDPAYREAWADSDLRMQIAFELCDARKRAGLTRTEVAQRIRTPEGEVAEWEEGGGRIPDLDHLHRYALATGSRLRIILGDEK